MDELGEVLGVLHDIAAQSTRAGDAATAIGGKLDQQADDLADLTARLKWTRVGLVSAVIGFAIFVAFAVAVTVRFRHQDAERVRAQVANTCTLRNLLVSAQSSAVRNPVPDDLSPEQRAFVEASRKQAQEFYTQQLAALPQVTCPAHGAPGTG